MGPRPATYHNFSPFLAPVFLVLYRALLSPSRPPAVLLLHPGPYDQACKWVTKVHLNAASLDFPILSVALWLISLTWYLKEPSAKQTNYPSKANDQND